MFPTITLQENPVTRLWDVTVDGKCHVARSIPEAFDWIDHQLILRCQRDWHASLTP